MTETPETVLEFWFNELTPKQWFVKDGEVDRHITERFAGLHLALSRLVPPEWRASPEARLALVIVFDQFPRNMYRGSPLIRHRQHCPQGGQGGNCGGRRRGCERRTPDILLHAVRACGKHR